MDGTILLFLLQDGITNGAVYALLGISLVLVFAVTKVIFIPQGEFVAFGALTYASLEGGRMPGTAWLLFAMGAAAFLFDLVAAVRGGASARRLFRAGLVDLVLPGLLVAASAAIAGKGLGPAVHFALTLSLIVPMGHFVYRVALCPSPRPRC